MKSPSALVAAGVSHDHGGMWIDERGSEVLSRGECRRLLALGAKERRHGHLGVPQDGAPLVLPVNYTVDGPDVMLLVGDGLLHRVAGRLVAFQVDATEIVRHLDGAVVSRRWTVLVRGLAVEQDLHFEGDLPVPAVTEPGRRVVRIRGDVVTGRRLGEGKPASAGRPR